MSHEPVRTGLRCRGKAGEQETVTMTLSQTSERALIACHHTVSVCDMVAMTRMWQIPLTGDRWWFQPCFLS